MQTKLSARSIPIDHRLVSQIAEVLLKPLRITSQGFLKEAAGDLSQIGLMRVSLYDMSGKLWQVSIRLEPIWTGQTRGQTGDTNAAKGTKNIDVWLNDIVLAKKLGLLRIEQTGGEKMPLIGSDGKALNEQEKVQMHQARVDEITEILVHEFAHALDPQSGRQSYVPPNHDWDNASDEQRKKYINQPSELIAFTSQIVYEVSKAYRPGVTAQDLLAQSKVWNTYILPYVEVRKRAKIIDAVQRWMQEMK